MTDLTVELAAPGEFGDVGKLVNKLLNELFPDEEERDVEQHIRAAEAVTEKWKRCLGIGR